MKCLNCPDIIKTKNNKWYCKNKKWNSNKTIISKLDIKKNKTPIWCPK